MANNWMGAVMVKKISKMFRKDQIYESDYRNSAYTGKDKADAPLSDNLDNNLEFVRDIMGKSSDLIIREFSFGVQSVQRAALLYLDGLADKSMIQEFIIKSLTSVESAKVDGTIQSVKNYGIAIAQMGDVRCYNELFSAILSGDTAVLLNGSRQGLKAGTAGWEDRGVQSPEDQTVVRGPRDAFTENLRTNTSLVRRKIKNPNLWLKTIEVGTLSQTSVGIMYIKGIADESAVKEVIKRIEEIKVAGVLESGTIEEFIEDKTLTPFPTMYNSERPDVIAAGIMEGRVAILVDGSPFVLLVPALFVQFFQAAEDYYQRMDFGLLRLLRVLSFFIALVGPSLYIAITTFHQEMIPTPLMISIAEGREGVPFPAFVEAMIMETTFEILREAGVRMPRAIGQAVSIVGALVIGQAAVEAGLISPGMVIVVSITAISSFVLPAYSMGIAVRMLRFPLMGLAAAVGLYGIFIGFGLIATHLCGLKSFGVPYMAPFSPFNMRDQKDSLIRLPKMGLALRISSIAAKKKKR